MFQVSLVVTYFSLKKKQKQKTLVTVAGGVQIGGFQRTSFSLVFNDYTEVLTQISRYATLKV